MKINPDELKAAKEKRLKDIAKFESRKGLVNQYLRKVPESLKNLFFKVYKNDRSKANAIKAKCLDCSNFDRNEVKNCTVEICPLWNLRPFQKKVGS